MLDDYEYDLDGIEEITLGEADACGDATESFSDDVEDIVGGDPRGISSNDGFGRLPGESLYPLEGENDATDYITYYSGNPDPAVGDNPIDGSPM